MDGVPFRGMKQGYWDIMLGQGLFLPSFEMGFMGVREGEETTFEFTFPKDYTQVELQAKTVTVWASIHKVLNPVKVRSVRQLKVLSIRNSYPLPDLDRLWQENDILYYLALKDIPERDLVKMPVYFLTHIYHYAKLHRTKDIGRMAGFLADNKKALNALGDMLCSAARYSLGPDVLYSRERYLEAANYYGKANSNQPDTLIKKASSLLLGGETDKALRILNSMPERRSLPFQELLLECLKVVEPTSKRIRSLDRHVLDLKVEATLDNETMDQTDPSAIQPVVHGA